VVLLSERGLFNGRKGFILATAASAVGLGNIWRFPTLAAQHGGGTFLVTYMLVVLLFGLILLITEIAIGRHTRKSPVDAFDSLNHKSRFIGMLASAVPAIIMPYYCVIGGWVLGFLIGYAGGVDMTNEFAPFISSNLSIVAFLAFLFMAMVVIYFGVTKGIEKTSIVLMPLLLAILVILVVYVLFQPGAAEGVSYYLSFDLSEINGSTLVAAMSQSFFSMSIAMGILITYGSYMDKKESIEGSALIIAVIDTAVAILAGLLIVPMVYETYAGNIPGGPTLIFSALPNIFVDMPGGEIVGLLFFVLVFLAALTSAISVAEAVVATIMDRTGMTRQKAVVVFTIPVAIVGTIVCLGFGPLSFVSINGYGILDMLDYLSNSIMMPIVAFSTCVFIGHFVGAKMIIDEVESSGHPFKLKKIYPFMVKWVAPIAIAAILVSGMGFF